jgi:nucleoside-diphosphate kinase
MSSDVVTGMELVKENAISSFRDVMGDPVSVEEARKVAPHSIRARFGTDSMRNAIHGVASASEYSNEQNMFFSPAFGPTAAFNNCTCCIIKPHIVHDGLAGQVIDAIL